MEEMNKTALVIGIVAVVIALIFYTTGVITMQRQEKITQGVFLNHALGVFFDVIGTTAMFMIRPGFSITTHGIIGFIALFLMIGKLGIALQYRDQIVKGWVKHYSWGSYGYWLFVFFAGSAM